MFHKARNHCVTFKVLWHCSIWWQAQSNLRTFIYN